MMSGMGKRILCGLLSAVLTAGLCGCGGASGGRGSGGRDGFTPALDTDTACQIRVVGHYSNFESLEAEFDRFQEYYPNVDLSYTFLDNYNETINAALSGGNAPHIYCTFPWMLDKESYDELFGAAEDLSDAALGMDLSCIREGLLYRDGEGRVRMAPVLCNTYGMLVNEEIFQREGLVIPATYQDLLSTCDALREAGYESPVMGRNVENGLFCSLTVPYFCAAVRGDDALIAALNALEPSAAEAIRSTLELTADFTSHNCVDLAACDAEISDGYQELILRFFEGDVPMMFTVGDSASGTSKRESLSEAFTEHPFPYSFHPIPVTETGGYFLNVGAVEFSVNRNCENLDMANEFMRFLLRPEELNEIARVKRLVTTSTDLSLDGVYASFGGVEPDHVIYEQGIGLLDAPLVQMRRAAWQVGNGRMSIDEAIAVFGTLTE